MAISQAIMTGAGAAALSSNPVGWAVGGAMLLSDMIGDSAEEKTAKAKMGYIEQQKTGIETSLAELPSLVAAKTEIAEETYGLGLDKSMFGVGSSLFDLTRSGMSAISNVGFAKSGQVESKIARGERDIVTDFGIQRRGLQAQLGESLMGIAEWGAGQEGMLTSELARLDYEYKEATATANKGFFEKLFT
jgi:hypothetical protein